MKRSVLDEGVDGAGRSDSQDGDWHVRRFHEDFEHLNYKY